MKLSEFLSKYIEEQDIYTHIEQDHKSRVRRKLNDYVVKNVVRNHPKP